MENQKSNWNISPFIKKLDLMLSDQENQEVVCFNSISKKIEITDKKKMQTILRKYFRHGRFESFVRQLNWYGFHKINSRTSHCYAHPDLERGFSLFDIKSLRNSKRKSENQENEEGNVEVSVRLQENRNVPQEKNEMFLERTMALNSEILISNNANPFQQPFYIFPYYPQENLYAPQLPSFFNPWKFTSN